MTSTSFGDFGAFSVRHVPFSSCNAYTPHNVGCALLGAHAYWMLIGACNPVSRPIHPSRYPEAEAGAATDAYNMSVPFDDNLAVEMLRRERPWLMLDTDGHPLHLVTGCESHCKVVNNTQTGCHSYTVLTPLLPLGRTPASDAGARTTGMEEDGDQAGRSRRDGQHNDNH